MVSSFTAMTYDRYKLHLSSCNIRPLTVVRIAAPIEKDNSEEGKVNVEKDKTEQVTSAVQF